MNWDANVRDGDFLCCCEFVDLKGERNHLLACCCNCHEVDACCERFVTCRRIPRTLLRKIFLTAVDRMRIPWRGGAVQISLDAVAPIFLLPMFVILAAHGPWMSVVVFSFLPLFLLYAHFLFIKLKPQNHFFISWTITSTVFLFLSLHSMSGFLEIRNDEYYAFVVITFAVFLSLYRVKQREGLCFVKEDQFMDGGEKCTECNILLPPRAYHCLSCDACIIKRDQHCAWLNCCIGQYNHFWYMMFLIAILSQLVLCSNLILTTACHPFRVVGSIMLPDDCSDVYFDIVYATCFVISIYCLEAAVFVASVLVLECWLITLGITGHEFRNRSKRAYCCGLIMSRPYNKGFIQNWILFWKGADVSYQMYKI
ncbi:DHHC palmitoyltransferase [Nesidiocoris tenuis]|uniref:Palmitoyltransferase n=1 Tax=Nesidiocoris tenuis TaxID=355587 RepID=A0ABN7APJ9_9HEMI|nr:DHHC palmitoyltransferase [Nesidiocoris tenuis]